MSNCVCWTKASHSCHRPSGSLHNYVNNYKLLRIIVKAEKKLTYES